MMSHPNGSTFLDAPEAEIAARRSATRLRNVLRLNALFSSVTGVLAVVAAGVIADVLGVETTSVVRLAGGGLLVFAALVLAVGGARTSVLHRWALAVSIADLGWVAATAVVIAAGWVPTGGALVAAAIALIVLELGLLQLRDRRRLTAALRTSDSSIDESPPVELIALRRTSRHSAEELWPVITDHELYAKLALNLKAAAGLTPDGPGFQRACTDSVGRTWSETCTLWDPGRRFDVEVDATDYPYPLDAVQGSWRVDPDEVHGSTVGMYFAIRPAPGVAGRLFVPFMHVVFRPILARIARGWDSAAGRTPGGERNHAGAGEGDLGQSLASRD